MNIFHAVHYTIVPTRKNYLNNEELFELVIIYDILVTLMFDSGMIMCGEITCQSLLGVTGLRTSLCKNQTSWEMKIFNPPSNFACS